MAGLELLRNFPVLRTHDTDELRAWIAPAYALRDFDTPPRQRASPGVFNHCQLGSMGLTFADYGAPLRATLEQNDFYVQGFPTSGAGQVQWNRCVVQVDPQAHGIAGSPGAKASFTYDGDFSHLILRLSPAAVVRRLALLADRPIDPPLQLSGRVDPERAAAQSRLVRFFADELDRNGGRLPDIVLEQIEDAVVLGFLTSNEHNYSHLLSGKPRAAAPWQVRRAVDYIEQHWDESITIETLTRITETSARSLFQLFKKTHDVSPMVYLSQVRLRHARELLSQPDPETSVTKVGFMCGFSNLGHFAMKYQGAFGEKPSDTLKNCRK